MTNGVVHADREVHEYRCVRCGRLLFRLRGPFVETEIETVCSYRGCKRFNIVSLSAEQAVSSSRRQAWVRFNGRGLLQLNA